MHNYCTPHIIKENFENFLIHRCNYILLSQVYWIWQVVNTPTIILNNPVDSLTLHVNTRTRIHLHTFGHKLLQHAHTSLYIRYTLYTSIKVNKGLDAISSLRFNKTIMQCLDIAVVHLIVLLCDMFRPRVYKIFYSLRITGFCFGS